MTGHLVGRSDLLDTAFGLIDAGGAGVAVVGARGCGVSRVLIEIASHARTRGRRVRHVVASGGPCACAPDGTADVLVVDDAHQLDPADAEALRRAALDRAVQLVAGWHTDDPVPEAIGWCAGSGLLARLGVTPFDVDDVVSYLESRLGGTVHRASAAKIERYGAGLPAWIVPLCEGTLAAGRLERRSGLWRCTAPGPPTPAMLERARAELARLARPDADAFTTVCVAGELPTRFAGTVLGAGTLGRLEGAGMVCVHDETVAPIVPALADSVRAVAGRAGCAAAASRLLAAADDSVGAAHRARWRVSTLEVVPPAECAVAARDARCRGDDAAAERLARRASEAGDHDATWMLAEVLQSQGRRTEAAEVLERLGRAAVPDDLAVLARIELATILLWDLGRPDEAVAIVDELVRRAAGRASERVAVAAAATTTLFAGRPAAASALAARLVDGDGTDHVAATAWMVVAVAGAATGGGPAAVEAARRAIAARAGLPPAPATAGTEILRAVLVLALGEAGALREAAAVARADYDAALRAPTAVHAWAALAWARIALLTGEAALAERLAHEAAAGFADVEQHACLRWAVAARVIAAAYLGRGDEAAASARELDTLGRSGVGILEPDVVRAHAWAAAATGDLPGGRRRMTDAARIAIAAGSAGLAATAWHDLARLGDARGAAAGLRELARSGRAPGGAWAEPRALHAEAVVERDASALLAAAARFAEIGAGAHALDAAADALNVATTRRDRPHTRAARAALAELRTRFGDLATPALRAVAPAPLSPRELEVVRLAAGGSPSRVIADHLGVSVRTVDNLLQRAYQKLGVHNRAELRAALERGPQP